MSLPMEGLLIGTGWWIACAQWYSTGPHGTGQTLSDLRQHGVVELLTEGYIDFGAGRRLEAGQP